MMAGQHERRIKMWYFGYKLDHWMESEVFCTPFLDQLFEAMKQALTDGYQIIRAGKI